MNVRSTYSGLNLNNDVFERDLFYTPLRLNLNNDVFERDIFYTPPSKKRQKTSRILLLRTAGAVPVALKRGEGTPSSAPMPIPVRPTTLPLS